LDNDFSLLSSVGEVVVSAGHVPEGSSLVHSNETSIEISWGSIELHAIGGISLNCVLVVVVVLLQVSKRWAVSLSEHAHPLSELLGLKERGVGANPAVRSRVRSIKVRDLDHVASVSLLASFSGRSGWVSVASSPLEVDIISRSSSEESWDEIVLGGRVSLDNVSSLSSDVQVEDSLKRRDSSWSGSDVEHVRSVLEGSSELRSINGKRHVESILSNVGILGDRGVGSVVGPINESRVGSVSAGSKVIGGNVVSHSQDTVAVVIGNARLHAGGRNSPVERGGKSINGVTQVVVSGPSGGNADGGGDSPSGNFSPFVSCSRASSLIVFSRLDASVVSAEVFGLDVLGFSLVECAPSGIHSQNGNVSPGSGGPVRIIISLLSALISVSVGVVVLSRVGGGVSVQTSNALSISNEETLLSLSGIAGIIIDSVLVHSVLELSSGISSIDSSSSIGNSISGSSITKSGFRSIVGV